MSGAAPDTARELALREIRLAVHTGELRAGEVIREDRWSARLGVSRTPLREALAELCVQGLLRKDGRSIYVFRPSRSELFEIYDIREELEVLAAKRAALNRTPEVLDDLDRLMTQLKTTTVPTREYFSAHERFHVLIAEASGMPRLAALVASLREQSEPYIRIATAFDAAFRAASVEQHEKILRCMIDGDHRAIAQVVRRHLKGTRTQVKKMMVASGDSSWLV